LLYSKRNFSTNNTNTFFPSPLFIPRFHINAIYVWKMSARPKSSEVTFPKESQSWDSKATWVTWVTSHTDSTPNIDGQNAQPRNTESLKSLSYWKGRMRSHLSWRSGVWFCCCFSFYICTCDSVLAFAFCLWTVPLPGFQDPLTISRSTGWDPIAGWGMGGPRPTQLPGVLK
jgi:hypothetical protein